MKLDVKTLKILLTGFWITTILEIWLAVVGEDNVQTGEGVPAPLISDGLMASLALVYLILMIVSSIGLFRLANFSRHLFLITNLLSLVLFAASGPIYYAEESKLWDLAIIPEYLSFIFVGAVILLCYSEEGRELFQRNKDSE